MRNGKMPITVLCIYLILYFTILFPAVWHFRSFLTGITGHHMAGVIIGYLIILSFIIHLIAALTLLWCSISAYIRDRRILPITVTTATAIVLAFITVYVTLFFPVSDLYGRVNLVTRQEEREKYISDLSEQHADREYVLPYDVPLEETDMGFDGWQISSDNSVHVKKSDGNLTVAFTVGWVPTIRGKVRREVIYSSSGEYPTEQDITDRYSLPFGEYEVELLHVKPVGDNTFDVKYRITKQSPK